MIRIDMPPSTTSVPSVINSFAIKDIAASVTSSTLPSRRSGIRLARSSGFGGIRAAVEDHLAAGCELPDNFFTVNGFPPRGVNISGPAIMAQTEDNVQ